MHVKSDSDNLVKGQISNLYDAGSGTQLNDPDRSNQSSFFQLRQTQHESYKSTDKMKAELDTNVVLDDNYSQT